MLSSELDADRNPVRGYVYGNEYISQNNGSSSGYYLNDEQGSIRYLTGSDGSIRNHYRYSAFGESITAEETVPNRLKYNAQMADELTGLYYLRARYYNASLGRFTQEDVIYNDGLNLYAYCNSNPVMYSDPSGFAKETCKSKVGGECDSESGTTSSKGGNDSILALPAPSGTNPWLEKSDIVSMPAPDDCYIDMALAPGQNKPGGWGTLDSIPDVDYVRNSLAVTPEFKPEVGYVQRYKIPKGVRIQVGTVGPQQYKGKIYVGGGNQVQILNFKDRAKLIPIGKKRPIY